MDRKTVLDKIAKLASVADDQAGTPEGKAAEQMVLKLAHKYRIETSEINRSESFIKHAIETGKMKRNANEGQLYLAICDYCGVVLTVGWYFDEKTFEKYRKYTLWGYQSDIDNVRYLFNVIHSQITTMCSKWFKDLKKKYRVEKHHKSSYELGLVAGVRKRLSQLLKGIFDYNGEKGLVPLTKPEQQIEEIREAIGHTKKTPLKDTGSFSRRAFALGNEDSKNISIHRPIDLNPESSGLQIEMVM